MLKVLGVVADKFRIKDLEDGSEELVTADVLVLLLARNEFDGCKHSRNGIEVWYNGVEPYEIAIEVWKPISVYNCKTQDGVWKYWVSNLGRVASPSYVDRLGRFHEAHILHGAINIQGYVDIILRVNNKARKFRRCRIVAIEFVFNNHSYPIVNHKNEVKNADWCGNLEWCTYQYNMTYNDMHLRRGLQFRKRVRQYTLSGVFVKEFGSLNEAALSVSNASCSGISQCCRRHKNCNHAAGFIWRHVDDDELYALSEEDRQRLIRRHFHYAQHVRQYNLDGSFVNEYSSGRSASLNSGAGSSHISKVCRKLDGFISAGGFLWRYASDDEFADRPENVKAIAEWRRSHNV